MSGLPRLPGRLFGDDRDDMHIPLFGGGDKLRDDRELFSRPEPSHQRWDEKELDRVFDDDDNRESSGEAEYEQWYMMTQNPDPMITQNLLINRLRKNDAIIDRILGGFRRSHPAEYAKIVKDAEEKVAKGSIVVLDLVPRRPRRERSDGGEEEEGRRPATPVGQGPSKQAPIDTPPSAGQDDESSTRRNRRRLSPPSEDEFIDAACTYLVDEICGSKFNLDVDELHEPIAEHIGALAEDVNKKGDESAFGFFFDQAVARAVKNLFGDSPVAAAISCAMCGKEGGAEMLRCSACKQIHYCGVECQRSDWKISHKFDCAPPSHIAGKDDDDGKTTKREPTTLLRRKGTTTTSRGTQHAQIVLDKELATRSRERLRAADEAKRAQKSSGADQHDQQQQKELTRTRERVYQTANVYLHFTDQAVVSINGRKYGSEQETRQGETYPVKALTSLVTHAGEFTFRDGRYRFLQSKDGTAYRRKYPSERGKTSSAPWEHYHPLTKTWNAYVGHPESATGWEVYIK